MSKFSTTVRQGVESLMSVLATLAASVLVAREFGLSRLGNYNFVVWLAYLAGTLGSVGIPITTRKFMAELEPQGVPKHAVRLAAVGRLPRPW